MNHSELLERTSAVDSKWAVGTSGGGEDDGNNETVQTEGFGEDENQDHGNVELTFLTVGTDAGITNDTDGETSTETRETAAEAGGEVSISEEGRVLVISLGSGDLTDEDGGSDEAVDTQHTSHDNGDDVFHNLSRVGDTHRGDTNSGLSSTVGGTQVGKNEGGGDTHEPEERGGSGTSEGHDNRQHD